MPTDLNDAKTYMDANPQYFTNNSTNTGSYKVKIAHHIADGS
ncbi:MAG: hypothetical protein WDM90_13850 [Ferruginibacter sp.]